MLFVYIIITILIVFFAWIITAQIIETSVGNIIATMIITGFCYLGTCVGLEIGSDYAMARQFNARKQVIELTLQSDYITDEMKIAYAQKIVDFNQDLLKHQSKIKIWWNLPCLNQRCLEIEPIK
jgi:hypothetical protein